MRDRGSGVHVQANPTICPAGADVPARRAAHWAVRKLNSRQGLLSLAAAAFTLRADRRYAAPLRVSKYLNFF